jgi:hypothetical protein
MEITVSVKCTDTVIEIPYNTLIKWNFFSTMLSTFSTKVTKELIQENNNSYYIYKIPVINVDCKSSILNTILTGSKIVFRGEYDDDLIEFLYINGLMGGICTLKHGTWGFNYKEYIDLLLFIKDRMPTVNTFEFLYEGGMKWEMSSFLEHLFEECVDGTMPDELIEDYLHYTSIYYTTKGKNIPKIIEYLNSLCQTNKLEIIQNINPHIFFGSGYRGHNIKINKQINEYPREKLHSVLIQLLDPKNQILEEF